MLAQRCLLPLVFLFVSKVLCSQIRPVYLDSFNAERAQEEIDKGVILKANVTMLAKTGSWIEVNYQNLKNFEGNEVLAWYSPASSIKNLTLVSPVKYQYLAAHCSLPCSEGTIPFRLLNLRDEEGYAVGLFRGGLENPTLVSKINNIQFENPKNEVLLPHLALTGIENEMRISWVTGQTDEPQFVQYVSCSKDKDGFSRSKHFERANATTTTYHRTDMCGSPANSNGFHEPGLLHTAVMKDLRPSQKYKYRITNQVKGSFKAPPDNQNSQVRVAIFGDMGTAEMDTSFDVGEKDERDSLKTLDLLKSLKNMESGLDLVLHIGDISYARGYDVQWDEFLDQIGPISRFLPWMVAIGNHERDFPFVSRWNKYKPSYYKGYDSGGECGVSHMYRFPMPGPASEPQKDSPWYGFDFGPIHFTVMSTEHDFRPGSAQYRFLAADLASYDRTSMPWLVFAGHRPMYVDSAGPGSDPCEESDEHAPCPNDQPVSAELISSIEPLLLLHKVDLAVWGHHHSYQRSCHLIGGKCTELSAALISGEAYKGPVHLVLGMGGYELSTNVPSIRSPIFEYVNVWDHGIGLIEANSTHLTSTFYLDSNKKVGDEFRMTKLSPNFEKNVS
mmetsp:Transcript_8197/g.12429  ORF Transcript_8197/g.12429 Transcript_8197/m.12429 type:complete len:615 (-) Transcript_8197:57-1901(-)